MRKVAPFRIEWEAHEYEHKERSLDWFWAMGIISISIAIATVIFGNIILAVLVLVSVFSLALFINRLPTTIHVSVTEQGITRDKIHYPYSTLVDGQFIGYHIDWKRNSNHRRCWWKLPFAYQQ